MHPIRPPVRPGYRATSVPNDPGPHRLEARAPDHEPWSATVTIGAAESQSIEVRALVRTPSPPVESPPPPSAAPMAAAPTTPPPQREPEASGSPALGYVVGGAGVVALGVGAYFGIRALDLNAQAKDKCPTDETCRDDGAELSDDALTHARISTVAFGLGVIGVGVGAYLVLSAPRGEPAAAISTTLSPGGGAVGLSGRF